MVNNIQTSYYPAQRLNNKPNHNINGQFIPVNKQLPANNSVISTPQNRSGDQLKFTAPGFKKAKELKEQGNTFKLQGKYDKAIELYKEALKIDPNYTDVLYNLGKTYKAVGNMDAAIATLAQLVKIDPTDFESQTLLGAYYENVKNYDSALVQYKQVLAQEPNYDYARRNMYRVHIKKLALSDPEKADQLSKKIAQENLHKALQLIQSVAPQYIKANLQGITIAFGTTQEVNKNENLAQYENESNRILVSDKLMFASPNVIAAYLVHEAVHAGDRDGITSIREEQDAFGEMTRFWIANNNGILDPDLSLAMKLYNEHPENLDAKVASLYVKRDPSIRRTSPNHGEPSGGNSWLTNIYDALRTIMPSQPITGESLPLSSLIQQEYNDPQQNIIPQRPLLPRYVPQPNLMVGYIPQNQFIAPQYVVRYPYPTLPPQPYFYNNPFITQPNRFNPEGRLRAEGR